MEKPKQNFGQSSTSLVLFFVSFTLDTLWKITTEPQEEKHNGQYSKERF